MNRVLSSAVKKRLAIPIEATEVPNVFKFSDGLRYRIAAAAIVERPPVIVPEMPKWLTDYTEFKFKRDNELARVNGEPILDANQKLAAAGKPAKKDAANATKPKKDNAASSASSNKGNKATTAAAATAAGSASSAASTTTSDGDPFAFDPTLEDLALFRPAPRTTEADARNDTRSTQRALDRSLFLTVKKARAEHVWAFPQGGFEAAKDGAHLRHAAERELAEECGPALRAYFYGNGPIFHTEYLFAPDSAARQLHRADGTKLFFYPAIYLGGDVALDQNELADYQWMTLAELVANLTPAVGKLCRSVFFDPFLDDVTNDERSAVAAATTTTAQKKGN